MLASFDWSPIIAAAIVAIPATWGAVVSTLNRGQIKTPSGDTLGEIAERTHDMAALSVDASAKTLKILNGKPATGGEAVKDD